MSIFLKIVSSSFVGFGMLFAANAAVAADGSGANAVSPTSVYISSIGNNLSFTYTAAETVDSGGVSITVPSGWSTPNSTPSTAGYTTVSSASGVAANVQNTLDSAAGWTATRHMSLAADTGDKQEGTASLANTITATAAANEQWYFDYGAASNWGASADGNLRVGMWLKSSVNTASGDLYWQDDNTASLASPLDTISLPALAANVWTYTSATLGATSRTSMLSYGYRYTNDIGAAAIKADSLSVLLNANDSNAGWTGDANITDSLITGAGNFMEGTGAVRCTYAAGAGTGTNGDCWDNEGSAITVGPGTTVTFWVRSSVALNAGDFAWVDDNTSNLGSADSVVNLPAISANTWTYVKLTSSTSADMRSFGLRQLVDKGAMTIDIDAIGKQIDIADAATGWTAPTASVQTLSVDGATFHEGTASLKNIVTAAASAGDKWYETLASAEDWSGYTTVGFWVRSSVATLAGDLKFEYSTGSDIGSPIASVNIGALAANTWTYEKLTLSGTRTSVRSYGINYATDLGAATINMDDILLGPGSPTFVGNTINARILSLTTPQTLVVSYGSGGGSSGATAPSSTGNYTFTTQTRSSDSGTLTNISSQPVVAVNKITTTTALVSSVSPEVYGTSVTFTATVTPGSGGPATGTVTFKDGATTIGTGTLSSGVATYSTSTLSVLGSPHSITAVYEGNASFDVSTSNIVNQTMTAKTLTVTGVTANSKTYDRTTTATLNTGSAALVGVVAGDTVTLNTGSATGSFADKTVANGKTVTISGLTLSGTSAGNYSLTQPSTTANITAETLTVTGVTANNKTYDRTTTATLNTGSAALVGVISGDTVTLNTASAVGSFADKTVANGKTVTVTGLALSGADSSNYTLTQPVGITANITALDLIVTGMTASNKPYDGGTTATLSGGTLVGVISGDTVSISARSGAFADKTVGTGKTVNVNSVTLTGADSANYTVTNPSGITANITTLALTVTGMTASNKSYDGDTSATLNGGTLVGVISPDDVSIASRSGSFATKTVGAGKSVTVNSITLTGADSANYTVTNPTGITANITSLALTVTGMTASDKTYDRTTSVTLSGGTLVGVISPDDVSIASRSGSFADKTVGTGKTVTVSSVTLSGTDASNYTVTNPTDVTANITAVDLTVTGVLANDKTYDGNTAATLNTGSASLVGIISGDTVTLNVTGATGTFDDANVGTGKNVTVSGLALSGTDAGNYTLSQPTGLTANITNPVPAISDISPTSKNLNDPGFTLTVNGSNFIGSSVVNFNGSPRTTTFVNANQLTAAILSADLTVATSSASITVTNPGPGGGTSNSKSFAVADVATQFVIIAPAPGTVDGPVTVTVQAQKSSGDVDTAYQTDVTLNTTGSATGGGVVSITNGVGTIEIIDHVAETVHLTLTDSQNTNLSVSSSQDLVFSPGAVSQYVLNNPGSMNARTRLGYLATRKDQYGNSVLSGAQTAYLYTNSTSTDAKFYDDSLAGNAITQISFADGSATANFWYYEDMQGTYTITVSDNSSAPNGTTGIDDATQNVTVIPVAVKFVISADSTHSVDSPLTVTVQAEKIDNTVDTSFQDGVTLNTTGSATGGGLVTILNGVGTKVISDTVAETVHLSLIDSQNTYLDVSSSADVVWTGGVTTQFSLNHPVTLAAGSRASYTVSRKDQYGNATSEGDVIVYLYSSSSGANKKFYDAATAGNVITQVTIPTGQTSAIFWYYDETPGTWSISASDNSSAPNGATGISDAVDVLSVTPGPVATFTMNNPGDMAAQTRLGYTVTRKDQFGNLVTGGDTTVYLYTSAGALGSGRAFYDAATNGNSISSLTVSDGSSLAQFWYYEETPGTYTVSSSDSASSADGATGIADGTAVVNVSPAPIVATKFVILPPTNGTVDSAITITIQAQDNSGNVDTSATSSVTLITTGSATGAGVVTMVNGQGTINISDHNAETVHLSLRDDQVTGLNVSSTQDVIFSTGAAAQLSIDNPGNMGAGTRLGFTITRKDQYGNVITSGVTTVYLYSSSAGVNKKFYDSASGGSTITAINILDGQSTAQFWYYDELSGSATVTITDNASSPDGATGIADAYQTFTVTPGAIAKFLLNNPGNMTAGTRLGYTLTRKDQYDNPVTSGIVSAYLYSSATGVATKFYSSASGGFPETTAAFSDGSSQTQFWYYEEAPGTWVVTASDGTPVANGATGILDAADSVTVSVNPIVATRFVIQPVSAGTINIPTTVTIRAEDDNGNVDTAYNHNVTLVTSGSATGGGLVTITNGVGTATIRDAAAETVTLTLSDSEGTGLNVSSLQTVTFGTVFVPPANAPGISGGVNATQFAVPVISGFHFAGKAFPGAALSVVAIGGSLQNQKSTAVSNGNFSLSFDGSAGAARSFAIVGTDKNNNTTQVKIFDANRANSALKLDVNGILLSPTLGLARTAVTKGDVLGISGAGAPGYKVDIQVDNQPILVTATVDSKGVYKALVPTIAFDFGSHTIRTRQTSPSGLKSDYSPQAVFSVVNIFTPNMDLNGDGIINVSDYSIFVSRFQSKDTKVRIKDDLNNDGKVDVQDLSIFVRTLKLQ